MMSRQMLAALFIAALSAACGKGSDSNPVVCSGEARPSLQIEVVDSTTGSPISDPLVWVRDGEFVDTLLAYQGVHRGPFERPGTYHVHVEKDQYLSWVKSGVNVPQGRCHVETQELTARLQPAD
jgi:ribosomal protein S16